MTVTDALGSILGRQPQSKLGSIGGIQQTIAQDTAGGGSSGVLTSLEGIGGSVGGTTNPFPGGVGTWLDMGVDLTSGEFLSPYAGKVIVADQSNPGWRGGGYLAIQNLTNPSQVIYMAEGITPTVRAGQVVSPGQSVGLPRANPYNGTIGNIESGPADMSGQPLAKSSSNPVATVMAFVNWLKSLGGPTATAGHPGYA